jgi:hypothetical protein
MKRKTIKGTDRQYSRDEIMEWIDFGVYNGYINKYKKDQVIRWVDLLLKNKVTFPKIFTPKRPNF